MSALVEAALRGEEVVLAKAGQPVARIVLLLPNTAETPHLLSQLHYPDVDAEAFAPEPEIEAALDRPL